MLYIRRMTMDQVVEEEATATCSGSATAKIGFASAVHVLDGISSSCRFVAVKPSLGIGCLDLGPALAFPDNGK